MIEVIEVFIVELCDVFEFGCIMVVELVQVYLVWIDVYDVFGMFIVLNVVVVCNFDVLVEVQVFDVCWVCGEFFGLLDGIFYIVKDSYLVKGFIVVFGSLVFKDLVVQCDVFIVECLCVVGVICLGKINMLFMVNGGMQCGVYGCVESLYNVVYFIVFFVLGFFNGVGIVIVVSFVVFGLVEEIWLSGCGLVLNNGLCVYIFLCGVILVCGNWLLMLIMDVVVFYVWSMVDLLEIFDVVVVDDFDICGDFWCMQFWVLIFKVFEVCLVSYLVLVVGVEVLVGKCFGVLCMFINVDFDVGISEFFGIGGLIGQCIYIWFLVIVFWEQVCKVLEVVGVEVIEVDFLLVLNCEGD